MSHSLLCVDSALSLRWLSREAKEQRWQDPNPDVHLNLNLIQLDPATAVVVRLEWCQCEGHSSGISGAVLPPLRQLSEDTRALAEPMVFCALQQKNSAV